MFVNIWVVVSIISHTGRLLESTSAERDLCMLVDSRLLMSQQCALATKRAKGIQRYIKRSIASKSKEVVLLLYLDFMWPHCEYCMQFWVPQYKKDVKEIIRKASLYLI